MTGDDEKLKIKAEDVKLFKLISEARKKSFAELVIKFSDGHPVYAEITEKISLQ